MCSRTRHRLPPMRFAIVLKIAGMLLMMMWLAAAVFDIGPLVLRPLFLFSGALVSWWAMRTSDA